MDWLKSIKEFLRKVWDKLVKIFIAIVNFFEHIISWFKEIYKKVVKKRPNALPIALKIKENIETGNYNTYNAGLKEEREHIVKTFFDHDTGEILTDATEVICFEKLDAETKKQFGNKEMLVLE